MDRDPYDYSEFSILEKYGFLHGEEVIVEYREDYLSVYEVGDVPSQPQHWMNVLYMGNEHRYNWHLELFRHVDRSYEYIYDLELKVCEIMDIPLRKFSPLELSLCHYKNSKGYIFWAKNEHVSFKIQRRPNGRKYLIKAPCFEEFSTSASEVFILPPKLKNYTNDLRDKLKILDEYISIYSKHLKKIIKHSNGRDFTSYRTAENLPYETIVRLPGGR